MNIAQIHVYQIALPVKTGSYTYSGGGIDELDSTIVEIVCSNGLKGYGECCPVGRSGYCTLGPGRETLWCQGMRPTWRSANGECTVLY